MKLTKLLTELDEVSYNQMFDPETMSNLNAQSADSRSKMLGNKDLMQTMMSTQQLLDKVIQVESEYRDELEMLAVQIVKDNYPIVDYAAIEIDAKITSFAGVQDIGGEEGGEEEGSQEFDMAKRRITNAITHGASVRGTFNFNVFKDYIDQLDPELIAKYNELMKNVFGIYDDDQAIAMMLVMLAQQKKVEGGSEEIDFDEDGSLKIKARAICFPMLVHEIVKGLYEIVALQGFGADKERNKSIVKHVDKLTNEPEDLRYGKFIYDSLSKLYNDSHFDDPRIRELFFTEIYKLPDNEFKSFIDNTINNKLTTQQTAWADKVMYEIESDLKKDDTGLDGL